MPHGCAACGRTQPQSDRRRWRLAPLVQFRLFQIVRQCRQPVLFFYFHIPELIGVENLSAVLALYELDVILAGNNAHSGVFAGAWHGREQAQQA